MSSLALALTCLLATTPPRAVEPTFEADWPRLVSTMERAAVRGDQAALRETIASLQTLTAVSLPRDRAKLVRYAIAYAAWRLSVLPRVSEEERDALLDSALVALQEAVTLDERFAEAHALMGSVYGVQIGSSPFKG